jgi:hypothetical protein
MFITLCLIIPSEQGVDRIFFELYPWGYTIAREKHGIRTRVQGKHEREMWEPRKETRTKWCEEEGERKLLGKKRSPMEEVNSSHEEKIILFCLASHPNMEHSFPKREKETSKTTIV